MKNLKKMSLNLATKELSRKELKGILAGSGSYGCGNPCGSLTCAFTSNCPICYNVSGVGSICVSSVM
jgi:hypothetical protein